MTGPELPEQWRERVHPRAGSAAAVPGPAASRPVVDAYDVVRLTGASTSRTYVTIDRLVEAEVLDEADLIVDRPRLRRARR